jgi:hypothetical protein
VLTPQEQYEAPPAESKVVRDRLAALASMLPLGLSTIVLSAEKTADGVTFTIESVERAKH